MGKCPSASLNKRIPPPLAKLSILLLLTAIAVDTDIGNVYWTDAALGHIVVAREDGTFPVVIHRNLQRPWALAIHTARQ